MLVMRLRPDRTALLFGPHTETLCNALQDWNVGDTRKYVLVGNMVAPVCARSIASIIDEHVGSGTNCAPRRDSRRSRGNTTGNKGVSGGTKI